MSFEDFDPNAPSYTSNVFGVWADGSFKVYTRRASAMNRFSHWRQAKLYEFNASTGRWIERGVKNPDTQIPRCTACGGSTEDHQRTYDLELDAYVYDVSNPLVDYGQYVWERKGGKHVDPMKLHYACVLCYPRIRA